MPEGSSHIFICFSSQDQAVALRVVQFLETRAIKCWISLRDVPPGQGYQETIVHALERSKGIVFLFSEFSQQSPEIMKELSLGGGLNVPVFPLRLTPVTPSGALRYELATRQWIDMFPDPETALDRLEGTIRAAVLKISAMTPATAPEPTLAAPGPTQAGPEPAQAAPDLAAAPQAQAAPPPTKRRAKKVRAPIVEPGSEEFEAIRGLLARHIGPIAKIMVQKAATEARTLDDFCERLAAHVRAPADRAAFVQAARGRLSQRR